MNPLDFLAEHFGNAAVLASIAIAGLGFAIYQAPIEYVRLGGAVLGYGTLAIVTVAIAARFLRQS